MDKLVGFLEENLGIEDIYFNEKRDQGFFFMGVDKDTGEDKVVLVTNTNRVFIDGEEKDNIEDFNVWSLVK